MKFCLFQSKCKGDAVNCVYPIEVNVTDAAAFQNAAAYDHVCIKFVDDYRNNDNFLWSNVVMVDIENQQTEDAKEWITEGTLNELMPDVSYALVTSRSHMQAKNNKTPRPRYHIYFPVDTIADKDAYTELKRSI